MRHLASRSTRIRSFSDVWGHNVSRGFFRAQISRGITYRRRSGDGQRGVAVDCAHLGGLLREVGAGALDDAEPVDPDILDSEEAGNGDDVLEEWRKVGGGNAGLACRKGRGVGEVGRGRNGAPAVA